MFGLILETSADKGYVALIKGKHSTLRHLSGGPTLSHLLASEVEALLLEAKERPQFIATGTGPGSFTGVRVGAALGKALSFAWQIPLLGFCNLQSFYPKDDPECPVLFDARMGGFYYLPARAKEAILLPLANSEETLSPLPKIATPHPETILKRLPFLRNQLLGTDPHPLHLTFSKIQNSG